MRRASDGKRSGGRSVLLPQLWRGHGRRRTARCRWPITRPEAVDSESRGRGTRPRRLAICRPKRILFGALLEQLLITCVRSARSCQCATTSRASSSSTRSRCSHEAKAARRCRAPQRSRLAVDLARLRYNLARVRPGCEHGPPRRRLRQRRLRERHLHDQERTGETPQLNEPRPSPPRCLQRHRDLYNPRRRHSALGYHSPIEYENMTQEPPANAAAA